MPATFRPLLAAAALTAALASCDDPNALEAEREVVADTLVLYGINEAPVGAPTAFYLLGAPSRAAAVVATPAFAFDVAFDIRTDGTVRLIPPRALMGVIPTPDPRAQPHRVGLQIATGSYDALTQAPTSGYTYDSTLTVTPGQTVAVQSANPLGCPVVFFGTVFYAKLVVDSVRTDPARAFVRTTVDPNCNFRSLVPGTIPED